MNTYFSLKIDWKEEPYNGHLKIIVVLRCLFHGLLVVLCRLFLGLLNILLIPLGIVTFGIVCPRRYRVWVLSYAVEEDEDVDKDKCHPPVQSSLSEVAVSKRVIDLLMDRCEEEQVLLEKPKMDEQKKDVD